MAEKNTGMMLVAVTGVGILGVIAYLLYTQGRAGGVYAPLYMPTCYEIASY